MSEIRIPVSAPGANQAASELRGVKQAAEGVGKGEDQAAKASTKLAQANTAVAKSSKDVAQAIRSETREIAKRNVEAEKAAKPGRPGGFFQAVGRAGGAAGGVLGRLGGAIGLPAGMAPLAVGAVAAGAALSRLAGESSLAVERARDFAQATQRMTDAVEQANKTRGDSAAQSFAANGQALRSLITQGMNLGSVESLMKEGFTDAPAAMNTLAGFGDNGNRETALATSMLLTRLGASPGLNDALSKLPEERVAAARGMDGDPVERLLGEILGEGRGAALTRDEVNARLGRLSGPGVQRLDSNASARGDLEASRMWMAFDPAAAASFRDDRRELSDPVAVALERIFKDQEKTWREMGEAAKAEYSLIALLKDVFMPGGSFERQLQDAIFTGMHARGAAMRSVSK